jgi:hypothetical protein
MMELDRLKSDEDLLRKELESGGAKFRGHGQRECCCVFHDEKHPSAGIFFHDGAWLYKCHSCGFAGTFLDVRAKLNKRTLAEELRAMNDAASAPRQPMKPPKIFPTIDAIADLFARMDGLQFLVAHEYWVGDKLVGVVLRLWNPKTQRKEIKQAMPYLGGFVLKQPPEPHPLYCHGDLADAKQVIVVEGEGCVDKLRELGFVATTSLGGAGKASHTDWTPLAGKDLYFWADNDAASEAHPDGAGQEHMAEARKICAQLTPTPRLFRVREDELGLPEGGDVVDFCAARPTADPAELGRLISDEVFTKVTPVGIGADYSAYIEQGIAGQRRPISWPWYFVSVMSRALVPGCVTAICGDPGSGKSLLAMQAMITWSSSDIPAEIYELEDGRNYHLNRGHAQMCGVSSLLKSEWLEDHAEEARQLLGEKIEDTEKLGRRIWEPPPSESATYPMLLAWMEDRAKRGTKVMIVDPVTAVKPDRSPWIADHEFMMGSKRIAEKYECCPVLIVHPVKGHKGGGGMEAVSGGAVFSRLSHSVLWLEVRESDDDVKIETTHGFEMMCPNRILRVVKCRNGVGRGVRIGFLFDPQRLNYTELGIVRKT